MATAQSNATRSGQSSEDRKPIHTISRYSRGKYLQVSIWENDTEGRIWYGVKPSVRYQDDDGWKTQKGLDEDHLLPMAHLLTQADDWCQAERAEAFAEKQG